MRAEKRAGAGLESGERDDRRLGTGGAELRIAGATVVVASLTKADRPKVPHRQPDQRIGKLWVAKVSYVGSRRPAQSSTSRFGRQTGVTGRPLSRITI